MSATILGTKENPQYLDTIIYLFVQLDTCFKRHENFMLFPEESITDTIRGSSDFRDFNNFLELNFQLNEELKTKFMSYNESKLQDRYGNLILAPLVKTMIPTYDAVEKAYNSIPSTYATEVKLNAEQEKNYHDKFFLLGVRIRLSEWLDTICTNIQLFTPELYERNKVSIESFKPFLELTSRSRMPNADQQPQPSEPGVKLQWKGDKTDLAELVWALVKSGRIGDTTTGQPVTQKELTSRVTDLLGLDSLDVANLMKGRYGTKGKPTTFKAQDGKTFVNSLQTLLDQRVLD